MNDFTPPSVRIYQSVMSFLKYALGLIGLTIVAMTERSIYCRKGSYNWNESS